MTDIMVKTKIRLLEKELQRIDAENKHLQETVITLAVWLVDSLGENNVKKFIDMAKKRPFLDHENIYSRKLEKEKE